MFNILVIGSVKSTEKTISGLIKHGLNICGVLGRDASGTNPVSGYVNLEKISVDNNIEFKSFSDINDETNLDWARSKNPDLIFAVGFSQLLNDDWFRIAKMACIGFHPTTLPKGRGRAPLAWLVLDNTHGSATYFLMNDKADAGPIFCQEVFEILESDNATTIGFKIDNAIDSALDNWLPKLKEGFWDPIPQNENDASWYGVRMPNDSVINWNDDSYYIDKLIRASSSPHPGAFTFYKNNKVYLWKSKIEKNLNIKGVIGRILLSEENWKLIQCGNGLIWIEIDDSSLSDKLRIGQKLGYDSQIEIYKIWNKINNNE